MTAPRESSDTTDERMGLVEFHVGSSTSLAPFEEGSSILLDEFVDENSTMLAEFDASMDVITIDVLGTTDPEDEPLGPELPPEPVEQVEDEPVEEPGEIVTPDEEPPLEEEPVVPEPVREPANAVVGFVCRHALDVPKITDAEGRMLKYPKVHLIDVPCAGMVKMAWLRRALEKGASGAFVISCTQDSCHHRRGATICVERWNGTRRPMLLSLCDRSRLRFLEGHPAGMEELIREIRRFLVKLGKLDAPDPPETVTPGPPKPVEQVDLGDELM